MQTQSSFNLSGCPSRLPAGPQLQHTSSGCAFCCSCCSLLQTLFSDVKLVLEALTNIPATRQRLIYRGRVLRDDSSLQEQGDSFPLPAASRLPAPAHAGARYVLGWDGHNTKTRYVSLAGCCAGVEDGHTIHLIEREAPAPAAGG